MQGFTMKRKIAITVLLLLICATSPFLWLVALQRDVDSRQAREEEEHLHRMVRSLNSVQVKHDQVLHKQSREMDSVIRRLVPWLPKLNTLPNYFISGGAQYGESRLFDSDTYKQSSIVFLHQPRSAGSAMIKCLSNISMEYSLAMSSVMNTNNRILWDAGESNMETYRERLKVHRGRYTFGMCENMQTHCSYFTVLRDPYESAISSYKYCKSAIGDEICAAFNANKMTLREWILEQGSMFFRQIVFSPHFCSDAEFSKLNYSRTSVSNKLINNQKLPCWYRQKLLLEHSLKPLEIVHVTNYIVENLSKWFSSIGIFEELSDSLRMLEHVFNLPFMNCEVIQRKTEESADILSNRISNIHSINNENRNDNPSQYEMDSYEDIEDLRTDMFVKDALRPDLRIYKEAKRLFHIQKQVLWNKVNR